MRGTYARTSTNIHIQTRNHSDPNLSLERHSEQATSLSPPQRPASDPSSWLAISPPLKILFDASKNPTACLATPRGSLTPESISEGSESYQLEILSRLSSVTLLESGKDNPKDDEYKMPAPTPMLTPLSVPDIAELHSLAKANPIIKRNCHCLSIYNYFPQEQIYEDRRQYKNIQHLGFFDCDNLSHLTAAHIPFASRLESLTCQNCYNLKDFAIKDFPLLRKIILINCPALDLEQIFAELPECPALQEISLSPSTGSNYQDNALVSICKSLPPVNCSLSKLSLTGSINHLSNAVLNQLLNLTTTLQTLNLEAGSLPKTLVLNSLSLSELIIESCSITNVHTTLSTITNLQELSLQELPHLRKFYSNTLEPLSRLEGALGHPYLSFLSLRHEAPYRRAFKDLQACANAELLLTPFNYIDDVKPEVPPTLVIHNQENYQLICPPGYDLPAVKMEQELLTTPEGPEQVPEIITEACSVPRELQPAEPLPRPKTPPPTSNSLPISGPGAQELPLTTTTPAVQKPELDILTCTTPVETSTTDLDPLPRTTALPPTSAPLPEQRSWFAYLWCQFLYFWLAIVEVCHRWFNRPTTSAALQQMALDHRY